MTKRFFRTVREARGALSLDTGFDPFTSGGWGRCTKAKLADAGYVVDPVAAEQERIKAAEQERQREREREARLEAKARWDAMPSTQKYAAAAKLIGGGSSSMVEIGDNTAHVRNARGVCIVERVNGGWLARLPKDGERIYV